MNQEEKKETEEGQPRKKKKINKKIIIINIVAIAIILATIAAYFLLVSNKKNSPRGFAGENFDPENICQNFKNRQPSEGTEPPSGLSQGRSIMEDICADGEVTEEEAKRLEDMRGEAQAGFGKRQH